MAAMISVRVSPASGVASRKSVEQKPITTRQASGDQHDPAEPHVEIAFVMHAGAFDARGRRRGDEALHHRADQLQQRPHRRHRDGAGADEAHLMTPDVVGVVGDGHAGVAGQEVGQDRHRAAPGDEQAEQHGHADRQAHEVARAQKRQRETHVIAGGRVWGELVEQEILRDLGGGDARRGERGQAQRRDRAAHDGDQAFARFVSSAVAARARADFEHFGGGAAFGIGKVGGRHQRAAQRDREQHAEDAAGGAERRTRSRTESRSTSRRSPDPAARR